MKPRVFVAMSGGVDSSVAAAILAERGYDVVGVWMKLAREAGGDGAPRCCGTDRAGEDARRAAAQLGIPFYALDYAEVFGRDVVDRFVRSYASGETPNPCVACNQYVKFDALLRDVVGKFGAALLATGHYARVTTEPDGRRRLRRARDADKDQSYALYMLGQSELRRLLLPIGEVSDKDEVRRIAARCGLATAAKPESMDICFVPGDHRDLVRSRAPAAFRAGPVERIDGTVVGQHDGLASLTVGQRRGVGVAAGERLYVLRFEPVRNAAVVGRLDEVSVRGYRIADLRFTAGAPPAGRFSTTVALRYRGRPISCEVEMEDRGARVTLAEPALVAPGQAAVLYAGDEVIGGGTVREALAA